MNQLEIIHDIYQSTGSRNSWLLSRRTLDETEMDETITNKKYQSGQLKLDNWKQQFPHQRRQANHKRKGKFGYEIWVDK